MSFHDRIQALVQNLLALPQIQQADLEASLRQLDLLNVDIPEPEHTRHTPYARHVLFANEQLEVMLASWRRDFPCAPHDHGDSYSAIKVLRGRSHHRGFAIKNNRLTEVFSERKSTNDILVCQPKQIHAMGDDNDTETLVTLHLYAGSIDDMLVFSKTHSHLVSGQAGAWLPVDSPEYLLKQAEGHYGRDDLRLV